MGKLEFPKMLGEGMEACFPGGVINSPGRRGSYLVKVQNEAWGATLAM